MATVRSASCRCGRFTATVTGEPVRISVCHCLDCQKRSGSVFAAQARWPDDQVTFAGECRTWSATGDSGGTGTFRFCPVCGSTIAYRIDTMPGLTAIAIGAFADSDFPPPQYSNYENRRHAWVEILGDGVERR